MPLGAVHPSRASSASARYCEHHEHQLRPVFVRVSQCIHIARVCINREQDPRQHDQHRLDAHMAQSSSDRQANALKIYRTTKRECRTRMVSIISISSACHWNAFGTAPEWRASSATLRLPLPCYTQTASIISISSGCLCQRLSNGEHHQNQLAMVNKNHEHH